MHEFAEEFGSAWGVSGKEGIGGFGGGQVVADRADAAHSCGDTVCLFDGSVLHEFFKAAYVHDRKVGLGDVAFFI